MKKILIILITLINMLPIKAAAMDVSAQSAVVIDGATGSIVYEKNAHQQLPMASTTKIMTAIIALEASQPDEIVTVSAKAASTEGSSMYLEAGEKITMNDLLYGLMLSSGNDAACAIAEHIAPSMRHFATLMTKKAKLLGCKNTSFKNASGLDDEQHYTTSFELALITKYALQNESFREIVSTRSKVLVKENGDKRFLTNHNKMLNMYEGCVGVKTGFTKKCGRTLVSAAKREDKTFISVTLNAPSDWQDHTNMLNYAFNNNIKPTIAQNLPRALSFFELLSQYFIKFV